jgi:hypothetical protein
VENVRVAKLAPQDQENVAQIALIQDGPHVNTVFAPFASPPIRFMESVVELVETGVGMTTFVLLLQYFLNK